MKKYLILLLTAVLICMLIGCTSEEAQPDAQLVMGWNVDRDLWVNENGQSTRVPSGDSYRMRFAIDGEQVDLTFDSYELVSQADSMDFMWLELSGNKVTRVVEPESIAVENYFVTELSDNSVTCCQNIQGTGPKNSYQISENTKVYDITDKDLLCGVPGTLERGCRIWVVLDDQGAVSHAYVKGAFKRQTVYWNIYRKYNSTTKQTTRESDAIGFYTYDFAVDGQQVQLKTRDFAVACKIDSFAARCVALTFDEDGYIIGAAHGNSAVGGNALASWHHVTEITDQGFTAYKYAAGADQGSTATGTFADDCKVYDVSARAEQKGIETELRVNDQVHCMRDPFGDVCIIFVVTRYEEADIYWNAERKYANNATTRVPDNNGWYYLRMAHEGDLLTLKTQDKEIVDYIDSRAAKNAALRLDGDVIVDAFSTGLTFEGQTFCSWAVVTDISDDGQITAVKDGKTTFTGYMTEDFKAYNVSPTAGYVGVETDLRVGDRIHALKSIDGTVNTAFVVERPIYSPIYWNISRQYDSANKTTARTPDEDGWYYITFAVNGAQKTYKTNKKEIATKVDAISNRTMGLWVYEGVIVDVYAYTKLEGYTGSVGGWFTVTDIQGTQVTIEEKRTSSANFGKVYTVDIPQGTPVYNVSNDYESHVGEPSKVRLGDQLFTLVNGDNTAHVLIVGRSFAQPCAHCGDTANWQAWDGKSQFTNGGHYYLDGSLTQTVQIRMEKGQQACLNLNGKNITVAASAGRAFNIYGTLNLMGDGTVTATNNAVNMAAVTYIQNGGTFNMYGGTLTSQYAAPRAGIIMVQGNFNMYGGTVTGGQATGNGGNLEILNTGVFTMYDGTISGGKAGTNGGSIYSAGTIRIYDGTIEGGRAKEGGNIYMKKGTLEMAGGTISGGTADGSGGNIKYDADNANEGTVTVKGTSLVENGTAGGKGGNMYIRWTGKLYLADKAKVTGGKAAVGGGILCYVCKPTVSGSVQVTGNEDSDLYLDGNTSSIATVLVEDLEKDARIGIFMLRPGTFLTGVTQELLECFISNHDNYDVTFEDGKLTLK